ncbi:MAG: hypothetical protein KC933_32305 [Myxococcales bacterium]|nr:hypothetical protein [Myxococcales bacterium]
MAAVGSDDEVLAWVAARQAGLLAMTLGEGAVAACAPRVVSGPRPIAGWTADPEWRAQRAAVLLADWASYPAPVDQVSLARLTRVLDAFPRGFRTWWLDHPELGPVPVGYSGWYPIAPELFERLRLSPESITDRGEVLPLGEASDERALYLFNYSVIPQLRGGPVAGELLRALANDVAMAPHAGLCAITVSEDGARVARRFGMTRKGACVVDGVEEQVYCT